MFSPKISSLGWSWAAMEQRRGLLYYSWVQLWPELLAKGKVCLETILLLVVAEHSFLLWTWMRVYNQLSPVPGFGLDGQAPGSLPSKTWVLCNLTNTISITRQSLWHRSRGNVLHVCPTEGSLLGLERLVFFVSIFLLTEEKKSVLSLHTRMDLSDWCNSLSPQVMLDISEKLQPIWGLDMAETTGKTPGSYCTYSNRIVFSSTS